MGVAQSHSFCRETLDWYWKFGFQRAGKYALPQGAWLDQMYGVWKQLETLNSALAQPRPSVAVWGPSQTGKSTLVAKYIDAHVKFVGDLAADGKDSGLHFEGGSPAFFLKPEEDPAKGRTLRDGTCVLNPFNSGLDASACLSRFVLGSPKAGTDLHQIRDVRYPVELKFVKPRELWQSIARGYDSQCFGPRVAAPDDGSGRPAPRYAHTWTREKFMEVFHRFSDQPVPGDAQCSREAYEILNDFCDLVEDLIFAELPRFRQLQSGESNWKTLRNTILSDGGDGPTQRNALHFLPELAYEFTAEILWDGYQVLSDYYRAMLRVHAFCASRWKEKPVLCSLEVAALFLDMETYLVYLKPLPSRPRPKDLRIHRLVPAIAWEDCGDYIVIGAESSLRNKLVQDPEHFGILQGLVWEMVVPLNPANLPDTPFKEFLRYADLLDFPGVERGGQSGDKVDLDIMANLKSGRGAREEGTGERDEPHQFFLRILKRGKTSSIVCTYAQRLNIDAFNIFQDLDRDKPNGGQLVEGINAWWKNCAADYYRNPRGPSPLPLNFVLLWWADFFNEGHDFTNLSKKFAGLGSIIDPEISTTFALNYYSLPRGSVRPDREAHLPDMVLALKAEAAFKAQFSNPVSTASFEAMITDKRTGGTDFFFNHLKEQMQAASQGDTGRVGLLRKKADDVLASLGELMQQHELFPNPRPLDLRRDHLVRFRGRLQEATADVSEREMIGINHALRALLDVDSDDLTAIPRSPFDINVDYLRAQMQQWINAKVGLLGSREPDLGKIGLGDREVLTQTLTALAESIEPDLDPMAVWLRRLCQYAQAVAEEDVDLRRHLALYFGNLLVFGAAGPRVRVDEEPVEDPHDPERAVPPVPRGVACRYFRDFIEPFAGDRGHLETLINRQVVPITRPDQSGDNELIAVAGKTHPQFIPGHNAA
jgi:hypothetical protein